MEIFIGGGGDDLAWLGLGVVRAYATRYAAETGRPTLYAPNARVGLLLRRILRQAPEGALNIVGHSWGGPDAYRLALAAERRGIEVASLITLDPVAGPIRPAPQGELAAPWLNVVAAPSAPDASDRLTRRPPWSRKPSGLPVTRAAACVELDLNHWNVEAMMRLSGARAWLDRKGPGPLATPPWRD